MANKPEGRTVHYDFFGTYEDEFGKTHRVKFSELFMNDATATRFFQENGVVAYEAKEYPLTRTEKRIFDYIVSKDGERATAAEIFEACWPKEKRGMIEYPIRLTNKFVMLIRKKGYPIQSDGSGRNPRGYSYAKTS